MGSSPGISSCACSFKTHRRVHCIWPWPIALAYLLPTKPQFWEASLYLGVGGSCPPTLSWVSVCAEQHCPYREVLAPFCWALLCNMIARLKDLLNWTSLRALGLVRQTCLWTALGGSRAALCRDSFCCVTDPYTHSLVLADGPWPTKPCVHCHPGSTSCHRGRLLAGESFH